MNYCTLFNSHYLSRGLALYYSLLKHCADFHLYIFAFDKETDEILSLMALKKATIIPLEKLETSELLSVKPKRSQVEYCWTSTSATILYCLEKINLKEVCYLDADLFFWGDPTELILEAANHSILLTEHRYSKEYDKADVSGKYCVQFMYFKQDAIGLSALKWWYNKCLDWCYNRVEEGKFGDQKYLDDWPIRFERVKILENLGGGVAPWNIQQYTLAKVKEGVPVLREIMSQKEFNVNFFHFHALKFINNQIDLGAYRLPDFAYPILYRPYIQALLMVASELKKNDRLTPYRNLNIHSRAQKKNSHVDWLKNIKKRCLGTYNVFPLTDFIG